MSRKHICIACLVFVLLTLTVGAMGYRAKTDVEAVVTAQFNQQQLLLAEKIAADIADHFTFLRTGLEGLSLAWPPEAAAPGNPRPAVAGGVDLFARYDVVALGVVRPGNGPPRFFDASGGMPDTRGLCPVACGEALSGLSPGAIRLGRVFSPREGPLAGRRLVAMGLAVTDGPGGVAGLVALVDAVAVARRYAHDVRSGETGYAWVLDDTGIFLDHHETDFVGQESMAARRRRDPSIDWARLDRLLADRVMAGDRGTDWYVSGWHRGRLGAVRKLVAFCPVPLGGAADPGNRWAVALAAPQDEVRGLIGRLVVRQWLLVGLFEVVVFAAFLTVIHFALRFNKALVREVDKTARELLGAQEKLIRSERFAAIGEAAARLSHEIKNPLMLMGGFARQVRRHLPQGDADDEKLAIIESEAKRLETLLNEVRDFTRPAPSHVAPSDLNATVRASLAVMAEAMQSRGIAVETRLDATLAAVPHDADRIKQVLLNLLKNAAEAMESGGRLLVTTQAAPGKARLVVADSGGGIPESVRDRVFDPFCTTKESGTGLGLAVCQRIVEDHHGEIRFVTSAAGTTFTVDIPLPPARPA
ncbi:MAG: ATP-binding protein [Solidesulfovibrio sp.]|uniref:ATP-binding protein n=1 Tax=Solidesulfovibrio sp. TaxID=2910990 RepID=UPI002B1F33CD|nr:ATP-binding protein [Solidesulfovibrio sp.]MEA4856838.1 ATP-binding protein [Solidesulfovibrio sp.]